MKRVLVGAIGGALAVTLCRKIYTAGYKKGIGDGMDICKSVLDACLKMKADNTVEEEKDEEES